MKTFLQQIVTVEIWLTNIKASIRSVKCSQPRMDDLSYTVLLELPSKLLSWPGLHNLQLGMNCMYTTRKSEWLTNSALLLSSRCYLPPVRLGFTLPRGLLMSCQQFLWLCRSKHIKLTVSLSLLVKIVLYSLLQS